MAWIQQRQAGYGNVFYHMVTGTINEFINYYAIANVHAELEKLRRNVYCSRLWRSLPMKKRFHLPYIKGIITSLLIFSVFFFTANALEPPKISEKKTVSMSDAMSNLQEAAFKLQIQYKAERAVQPGKQRR